jgi:hypothetical protein
MRELYQQARERPAGGRLLPVRTTYQVHLRVLLVSLSFNVTNNETKNDNRANIVYPLAQHCKKQNESTYLKDGI